MSRSPLNYRDYIVDYINSDVSNYEGIMLNTSELNDIATYLEELDRARDTIDELRNKMDDIVEKLQQQAEQYRQRAFGMENKNISTLTDKYYRKQCSYLHAIEIVKEAMQDE